MATDETKPQSWFQNPARSFLVLAWTFGTIFAFLTPPFQIPDEYDHYYRAYQVSEGHLAQTSNGDKVGGYLPRSIITFEDRVNQGIPFHTEVKQNVKTLWEVRKIPLRPEDRVFVDFPWYAPTNYFPQAAAIALVRELGGGPLALLYAGRMGNLIVWSLLVYLAIRLIPMMEWTLVLLALMPMPLVLAASLSADTVVNGICFLFVATVLRFAVRDDQPINARRMGVLLLLGAVLALAKTAYMPLTLLFLLIPRSKFGGVRQFAGAFVLFMAVAAATAVVWALCTYKNFLNHGSSPHDQLIYMVHHPFTMARYFIGQLFSIPFMASIVGKLGWYDTRLSRVLVATYAVVLVLTARMGGHPEVRLDGRQRWIIAASAIGIWLAVFALVYLAFAKVGNVGINSLQGRYLIPMTPLVCLLFYPLRPVLKPARALLIIGFSAGFCIYIVAVIISRFYLA